MTTAIMDPAMPLGLLSSMFLCKPTRDGINVWRKLLSEDASIFMRELKEAVGKIDTDSEREIEDLVWEYTRLFIGPYKLPCPPWESVYTSSKKLMMQEAAGQVQEIYGECGFVINSADVMPDHIGAELNFLSILFNKMNAEIDKKDIYLKIARTFWEEHTMKWMPQFTRDMEEAADSLFYKTLAQTTRKLTEIIYMA
jgi:TorA maturation chaperone TorD